MSTQENLKKAFAGESQANRMYLAFAKKAKKDGFEQVAKVFRAAANAETVHALSHFEVMNGVNSTKENLKEAIQGETEEFEEMYPEMIETAEKEDNKKAKISFQGAMEAEKKHAELYKKALNVVENGEDLEEKDIFVCQNCGHTVEEKAPEECPVCGVKKEMFKKIE